MDIAGPDVAIDRNVHAAFAVGRGPLDGPVEAKAGLGVLGVGEDFDAVENFGRTAARVDVDFRVRCEPGPRHSGVDGVIGDAGDESVGAGAVIGAFADSGGNANDLAFWRDARGRAKVGIAPTKTDHVFVFFPADKGVFSRVEDVDAAPFADKAGEVFFDLVGPIGFGFDAGERPVHCAFIAVLNHHIVIDEPRPPGGPGRRRRVERRGADGDIEASRSLEDGAQKGGGLLPVVVAESVDDEDANLALGGGWGGDEDGQHEGRDAKEPWDAHGGHGSGWGTRVIGRSHSKVTPQRVRYCAVLSNSSVLLVKSLASPLGTKIIIPFRARVSKTL